MIVCTSFLAALLLQCVSGHVFCRPERENCQRLLEQYDPRGSLVAHLYDESATEPKILGKLCLDSRIADDCVKKVKRNCPATYLDFPALGGIAEALGHICQRLKVREVEDEWTRHLSCIASQETVQKVSRCQSEIWHTTNNITNRVERYCRQQEKQLECSVNATMKLCGVDAAGAIWDYGTLLYEQSRRVNNCDKGLSEGEVLLVVFGAGFVFYVIMCAIVAVCKTRPADLDSSLECGKQFAQMTCCICIALFRTCSQMKTKRKPQLMTTCGYEMQRL